jgi:hypothetical protein
MLTVDLFDLSVSCVVLAIYVFLSGVSVIYCLCALTWCLFFLVRAHTDYVLGSSDCSCTCLDNFVVSMGPI